MQHPDFRIGGKVFASLGYPDDQHGMVRLTPEQQRQFIEQAATIFTPSAGAWGRKGCTNIALRPAKQPLISAALAAAAENFASPRKPKSSGRGGKRA
jgi:hypothetical protein